MGDASMAYGAHGSDGLTMTNSRPNADHHTNINEYQA